MGNMCCRREVFAPNAADTDPSRCSPHQQHLGTQEYLSKSQHRPVMSNHAYHPAGDDCAINELLEGRMDLDVRMPDGRKVRLTVERRTPMMDLLVQAACTTKISPGGHVIQVYGDGDKTNAPLSYKPSTPIGSLDTNTIYIVPKKEAHEFQSKRMGKTTVRPFEPTFRVQVHLPRNQLTVLRVSPRVKIAELKSMVCKEKGLDGSRYQLVRPSGPSQPLSGDITLSEYGSTEITLLSNSSIESHICNSTSHILSFSKRSEEQKQRRTGILRLLAEDARNSTTHNSSKQQSDVHQQNGIAKNQENCSHPNRFKPKKRRPAPPPPPPVLNEAPFHSRQSSSDSSGYHEATSSFLHEEHSGEEKASSDSSGVSSLDGKNPSVETVVQTQPASTQNSKKKKAPAPPPPAAQKDIPPTEIQNSIQNCLESRNDEKQMEKTPETQHPQTIVQQNTLKTPSGKEHCRTAQLHKKAVAPIIPASEHSLNTIHSKTRDLDNILQDRPGSQRERNLVFHSSSFLKSEFAKKDIIIQKDYTLKDTVSHYGNTILKNLNSVQNGSLPQTNTSAERNNSDFIVPKHTSSPEPHESMVVLNNDHNLKDRVLLEDPVIQNDRMSSVDCVAVENPVSLDDPVLGRQNPEINAGVHNRSLESEGHQRIPPHATMFEKARDASEIPKNHLVQDERKIRDVSSLTPATKHKSKDKSEAVSTRVALVALNARIEQDVTQQEIASSIQAAFHSLDCPPPQQQHPSLLAIKQKTAADLVSGSESVSESLRTGVKLPPKSNHVEKEALLIDEDPPFRPSPATTPTPATTNLRRSSSLLSFTESTPRSALCKNTKRVQHLQRSLSDLSAGDKEDFETEQERLQQEYIKLQRQFVLWQQQLMNNHAMLREECIVPQYARTLRQSHSLPEGEDTSDDSSSPVPPLVSRSLSYEPTKDRCSTLPRSTINIPSLEFGSIQINSGTTTLRSSKTKNYFKPPQVRISTKSRQRLPPEIKKERDVDISDDAKMLKTILPSFESLKLITENYEDDIHLRLKDTTKILPFETKKVPVVHQSKTFPKINSKLINGDDKNSRCVNGDGELFKQPMNASKNAENALKSQLPPPPPPMPVAVVSNGKEKQNCAKLSGYSNGVSARKSADPRDQLMLEIRKFGGRTALRKISLAS